MNYISENEIERVTGKTGEALAAQPRVKIVIAGDGVSGAWEGGINGWFLRIPRGKEVEVPKSIARLIAQSASVTYLAERAVAEYKRGRGKKLG